MLLRSLARQALRSRVTLAALQSTSVTTRSMSVLAMMNSPLTLDRRLGHTGTIIPSDISAHHVAAHQLQYRRGLLHIPIIGVLTPKIIAALALKKTVVLAILQKYGVKGTFDILRATNDQLASQLGSTAYPPAAKNAVKAGLDALEMGITKMEPNEQAEVVWKWLKTVDPNLLVETFRKYVTTSPIPEKNATPEEKMETEEDVAAIKRIADQFPEINKKYHIVLVERDQKGESPGK